MKERKPRTLKTNGSTQNYIPNYRELYYQGEKKSQLQEAFVFFFLLYPNLAKSFPPLPKMSHCPQTALLASQTPLSLLTLYTSMGKTVSHSSWAPPYFPVAQLPHSPLTRAVTVWLALVCAVPANPNRPPPVLSSRSSKAQASAIYKIKMP